MTNLILLFYQIESHLYNNLYKSLRIIPDKRAKENVDA